MSIGNRTRMHVLLLRVGLGDLAACADSLQAGDAQCAALNLEGDCCPSADGAMLACCFNDDPMQVCDASQTSINAAMLNCSLYDATSGHYAACLYDYCATGGGAVTDAQADLAAAGTTTVDCPSYDFKVSQGATLLYGAGAASLNDHLHTQALPGVASEASRPLPSLPFTFRDPPCWTKTVALHIQRPSARHHTTTSRVCTLPIGRRAAASWPSGTRAPPRP